MTNKASLVKPLLEILWESSFLSPLVGDSHQVRTMITVERLRVFYFKAHITLQVDIIQVVASKERWPGDLLPETLYEFGQNMIFPPLPR